MLIFLHLGGVDLRIAWRIKSRIKKEGLGRTVIYCAKVVTCAVREFFYSTFLDIWYSGRLLNGNHTSNYKHLGSNDVYHSTYQVLRLIFQVIPISETDVLVDVGCGKGRVINYWLSKKLENNIIGLELDPEIAERTASQFSHRKNVRIIPGDAIAGIPPDGTVFYFYNSFSKAKVILFEEKLSVMFKGKLIKIIYYNPKSIQVFQNGKWNIRYVNFEKDLGKKRWGRLYNFHELSIITNRM